MLTLGQISPLRLISTNSLDDQLCTPTYTCDWSRDHQNQSVPGTDKRCELPILKRLDDYEQDDGKYKHRYLYGFYATSLLSIKNNIKIENYMCCFVIFYLSQQLKFFLVLSCYLFGPRTFKTMVCLSVTLYLMYIGRF